MTVIEEKTKILKMDNLDIISADTFAMYLSFSPITLNYNLCYISFV